MARYQYETSPRKLQPSQDYRNKKKNNSNKKKSNVHKKVKVNNSKIILAIGIAFVILFAISYRNALIAQKYNELKGLKTKLAEIEKENKQIEVNIESKTNLGTIEEKASKELGLKKLDSSQTVYVSLDKQDYVESSVEKVKLQDESWFNKIINKIKDIF
jgi:cell division protein FtsL